MYRIILIILAKQNITQNVSSKTLKKSACSLHLKQINSNKWLFAYMAYMSYNENFVQFCEENNKPIYYKNLSLL